MAPELNLETEFSPSGWVLVQTRLGALGRHFSSSLRVYRHSSPDRAEEVPLPIFPDGGINELVRLPDDTARLGWRLPRRLQSGQPQLAIRRVGWPERILRMTNRVARTYLRLSGEQRAESGLTFWRSLYDLSGAYRIATGFRVRYPMLNYQDWIERFDALTERDAYRIQEHIARFATRPHFYLLLAAVDGRQEAVRTTLDSLRGQLYGNFTCAVLDLSGALEASFNPDVELKGAGAGSRFVAQHAVSAWLAGFNASLAGRPADDWVMLLHAGDTLSGHALYWFACEAQARPDAAVVYSDDDTVDAEGVRAHPRFKPEWSPAHLRSTHYVGAAAILRGHDVAAAGGVSLDCCRHGNYGLLLRVTDADGKKAAHVPALLFHRGGAARADDGREDPQWCAGVLLAHLARNGIAAEVTPTLPGLWRVRYRLPDAPPLVSLIVPTRDAVALLRQCIESVLEKTAYPRYEILVVDNQSTDPEALAYLGKIAAYPAVRVLRYDRRFNFSAINNFAVRAASGDALCLLNNDTEVISPDWLDEMVGHLLQKRVGAVGAKLYYPNGRVQHAGVTVGPGGCADHLHIQLARDEPGYCGRAMLAQEYSAVTGACLLTWRRLYGDLGGLDETRLTVAFNDIDYCLRLQEAGFRVIFTPHAELVHHESATRGNDDPLPRRLRARREVEYMRQRWRERMRDDPYYNPNLTYRRPDFSLSETPRVKKPWL